MNTTTAPATNQPFAAAVNAPRPRGRQRRVPRNSRWRWRLRWGRPLPWPTRVEILATLLLWLGGAYTWERWEASRPLLALLPPSATASNDPARPLVTGRHPDADGFYSYRQDRLEARVPVTMRLMPPSETEPDVTRARGRRENLSFELSRAFDFRARFTDGADLAHDAAAAICRAADAILVGAEDVPQAVGGGSQQASTHTVVRARQKGGRALTFEGLTVEDGPVAWSLWAGYPSGDARAAMAVRETFASVTLRTLAGSQLPSANY